MILTPAITSPIPENTEIKDAQNEIDTWKSNKHKIELIPEFNIPHELINVLISTTKYHGLIFYGEGGVGKTMLTLTSIKNALKPKEWEYSNGYTTPLSLYEFLYKNRNKKVIILDDVEGLFNHNVSLSILKGALWDSDGKRIVQYSSKSEKANMPSAFVMNAKILILCNNIPKENDIGTRAMMSRTISYNVSFSFEQKMDICSTFVDKDEQLKESQKEQILLLLHNNVNEATKDFNFRTLRKLITFVCYDTDKAEELFRATTPIDELKAAYLKSVKASLVIKEQIKSFTELTGKSRRTYFTVKKQMSAQVQLVKDTKL